jgi:hypothetical protein
MKSPRHNWVRNRHSQIFPPLLRFHYCKVKLDYVILKMKSKLTNKVVNILKSSHSHYSCQQRTTDCNLFVEREKNNSFRNHVSSDKHV